MNDLIKKFNEQYFTKKEIQYRLNSNLNINEFWKEITAIRKNTAKPIPLKDQKDENFWFNITEEMSEYIAIIDKSAMNDLFKAVPEDLEVSVIADALIDEAFNSSVIEGAFSTKRRTKEMIENHLEPSNKSEIMIMNNYHALVYIMDHIDQPLNEDIILSVYRILTRGTLKDEDIVEKYRTDSVYVFDTMSQKITYTAPEYTKVQELMNSLLEFINGNNQFHPVIKACIIHFYFVYIHPFFDGNGRTSRAIAYMYLLQNGYNFFKFFSISSVINEEKNKYYNAIENTEIYDSDMTYFIKYYCSMIVRSINKVMNNFQKEFGKKLIENTLIKAEIVLGKRQLKIINHFITIDKNFTTVAEYQKKFKISYETARTDLLELEAMGFFKKSKKGKKYIFVFRNVNDIVKSIKENFINGSDF
ncbi:MAG: Fic family protein [Aminipila sp.]